ncbi:hypothetical protein AKJ51_01160 [candidate division MSBL1 archaeon SCGC-AAA382A20]|uniref:Uncharacterized protein n=1 Tax=candidate division MSBL1 archaeon SCGC-AAA382A20 TaxID=1698280 RepID=A0A133VM88_9EURY|nr:hypothetical protein AKJ51_01160 [candidate division MSBL1 archaeon SCGC-AAA382A20]
MIAVKNLDGWGKYKRKRFCIYCSICFFFYFKDENLRKRILNGFYRRKFAIINQLGNFRD